MLCLLGDFDMLCLLGGLDLPPYVDIRDPPTTPLRRSRLAPTDSRQEYHVKISEIQNLKFL